MEFIEINLAPAGSLVPNVAAIGLESVASHVYLLHGTILVKTFIINNYIAAGEP
jgi:hypothetical protein